MMTLEELSSQRTQAWTMVDVGPSCSSCLGSLERGKFLETWSLPLKQVHEAGPQASDQPRRVLKSSQDLAGPFLMAI